MRQTIKLSRVDKTNVSGLTFLLVNDIVLLQALNLTKPEHNLTDKRILTDLKKWQSDNNATSYAILLDGKSIGLISLSHQEDTCARVGYWIASQEWGRGYTTKAFKEIIKISKIFGFKKLSATIEADNIASQRIWKKLGADFIKHNNKLNVSLTI